MFGLGKVEDEMAFNRQRTVRFYDEKAKPAIPIHQKQAEFAASKFGVASSGKNKIFVAGDELWYNAKPDHATLIAILTACSALASRRIGYQHMLLPSKQWELRMLYKVSPVAVVGGSFLSTLAGHNLSEAAAAGCSVLTGPHVGHFYQMLVEMWQINPLAVKQVTGEFELLETLKELFGDSKALRARQRAAKDAFSIMSDGVVNRVWNLVCSLAINSQIDTWNS